MTDEFEEWEPSERIAWSPKTPREERAPLANAPLATLSAAPASPQAFALMSELAKRYPRPQAAKGASYARERTLVESRERRRRIRCRIARCSERDRSGGWLRCSLKKSDYTGQTVTWRMFDAVRQAFTKAGLVEHKQGYPGGYAASTTPVQCKASCRASGNTGSLSECEAHGVTPATVREYFEFVM